MTKSEFSIEQAQAIIEKDAVRRAKKAAALKAWRAKHKDRYNAYIKQWRAERREVVLLAKAIIEQQQAQQ